MSASDQPPAIPSRVPALSSERAIPIPEVAEVLTRSRMGCAGPVGAVSLFAFGFVAATSNVLPVGPGAARTFTIALIVCALAWAFVPWGVQRWRANARLRALGLTDRQIAHVRRIAGPILRRRGGMEGDATQREIAGAIERSLDDDGT